MKLGLLIAAIITGLDQLTKQMMLQTIFDPPFQIHLTSFFSLSPVYNHGISFGMFPASSFYGVLFLILMKIAIILILLNWLRQSITPMTQFGLGMVIGGALGNVIDRISLGAVVDFFDAHYDTFYWPVFNVADVGISLGIIILLIDHFTNPSEQDTKKT